MFEGGFCHEEVAENIGTEGPLKLLGGNIYLIRGKAEPGTSIRVSGREASAGHDGAFQIQVTAGSATRELTLEAKDSQGNSSQYKVSLSARAGRGRT